MDNNPKGRVEIIAEEPAFSVDRLEIDKTVWSVYYKSVSMHADDNRFDTELIDFLDLEDNTEKANFGKGRELTLTGNVYSDKVLHWNVRLRGTRSMRVMFNMNRYFNELHRMTPEEKLIIRDNNVLPIGQTVVTDQDYVDKYNSTFKELAGLYTQIYKKLWPKDYEVIEKNEELPIVKCNTLEFGREIHPCRVQDIEKTVAWNGTKSSLYTILSEYNDASHTIVLRDDTRKKEEDFYKLPFDKTEIAVPVEKTTMWESKEPYNDPVKIKLYNKLINLVRFEVTHYNGATFGEGVTLDDIFMTIGIYMEEAGIIPKPERYLYTKTLRKLCVWFGIDKETLKLILESGSSWTSNSKNRVLTKKLAKRGLIDKVKRGLYQVDPTFTDILDRAQAKKRLDIIFEPHQYAPRYL